MRFDGPLGGESQKDTLIKGVSTKKGVSGSIYNE
jgi:hypothetical protein